MLWKIKLCHSTLGLFGGLAKQSTHSVLVLVLMEPLVALEALSMYSLSRLKITIGHPLELAIQPRQLLEM